MMEFICLLSSKQDETLGIKTPDLEAKLMIDLDAVESFRQCFDEGRLEEENVMIETKSGSMHCIKIGFDEFKNIYQSNQSKK